MYIFCIAYHVHSLKCLKKSNLDYIISSGKVVIVSFGQFGVVVVDLCRLLSKLCRDNLWSGILQGKC